MDLLHDLLVFLHFLGLAALFGGLFVQLKAAPRRVNSAVLHGVLTQLVTGLLLVGLAEAGSDADTSFRTKITVKLVVALVIGVLAWRNRRRESISDAVFFTLLGLTALNIAVAVFWS